MPRPPPPTYPPGIPPPPPSSTKGFPPGGWVPLGEGGQQAQTPPATGLAALGRFDSTIHTFVAALQGVVAARAGAALPSPDPSGPTGKVATLSLLHLQFTWGVAVDVDLPSIF